MAAQVTNAYIARSEKGTKEMKQEVRHHLNYLSCQRAHITAEAQGSETHI